jgi:DNA-binding NarL/FixJ family response regulator
MAFSQTPFSLFEKTINVLVVDDLPVSISLIEEFLNPFKIYRILSVSSTKDALDVIRNRTPRFHVCLFDLGMNDVENNEFYLLDKFGKKFPFIIMSAQSDTEKAFEAKQHGAMAYIRKGDKDFMQRIIANLNRQALRSIVCPVVLENPASVVNTLVEILVNKNPAMIADWAREANINDRKLRNEWEEHVGFCPKYSLCMYHMFSKIFSIVENYCGKNIDHDKYFVEKCLQSLEESTSCKRYFEYFLLNRSHIMTSIHQAVLVHS